MTPALRLLRILLSVIICIIALAYLGGFFRAVVFSVTRDTINPFASATWDLAFRAPTYLFHGTIPLTAIAFIMDRMVVRGWYFYIALWSVAAFVGYAGVATPFSGPLSGALYWLLAGVLPEGQASVCSGSAPSHGGS